jgi:tetratricopeptide (TPR) repeat protein
MTAMPRDPGTAFNTVETEFFREGDELSSGPQATGDGWDEPTVTCARRRRPRGFASWAGLAAAAGVASAFLACWHVRRASEPAAPAPVVAAPAPTNDSPSLAVPAPAASQTAPSPSSQASSLEAAAGALIPPPDGRSLAACKQAYGRHRGKAVLAACGRAFTQNPRSADVAVMLAKTEFDRGHVRKALDWAKKAIALDEDLADAYVFLGGAEQAAGRPAAARTAYQRYLQLAPSGRYAGDLRAVLRTL